MLYLADIRHDFREQTLHLKLLAQCLSEGVWQVLAQPDLVAIRSTSPPAITGLVLVELSGDRQTAQVQDATSWLLDIVANFLKSGVTAEFLQAETERAEQWRQSLTLQSQELGRRTLELEARMGQIQELEEKLQHKGQGDAEAADSTGE